MMISIIIPTYNRATFIERAIKSVISQTYQDFEIIIIDDCSQDNTDIVVEKLKNKYCKFKIEYLKNNKNRGAQHARNKGIKNAKGIWIAFLDSDDEWLPNKLMSCVKFAKQKYVSVVHSDGYISYGNGKPLVLRGVRKLSGNIFNDILMNAGPMFQGLLVKKECFEKINYLDENIVAHQEWETSIRLARYYEFGFIDEPLFIYHKGHEAISIDKERNITGHYQVVEKHKTNITKYIGKIFLQRHYLNLAYKSYDQNNYDQARYFFNKASILATISKKRIIKIQKSKSFMLLFNPRIIDCNILFRKFKKFSQKLIFQIRRKTIFFEN